MTYIVYGLWEEAYMLISGYGIYANFVRQGLGIWLGVRIRKRLRVRLRVRVRVRIRKSMETGLRVRKHRFA